MNFFNSFALGVCDGNAGTVAVTVINTPSLTLLRESVINEVAFLTCVN